MPFIISTLTGSQKYPLWNPGPDGSFPQILSYVMVHGGANLPPKTLVTPKGVVTEVSDDELERLEKVPQFCRHRERGYIMVEKKNPGPGPGADEIAADMEPKDSSAPRTDDDFGDDQPTPNSADISPQADVSQPAQDEKPKPKRRGRPPKKQG